MSLNFSAIIRILSMVLVLLGGSMIPSAIVSFIYEEHQIGLDFLTIIFPTILLGILIYKKVDAETGKLRLRDGFFVVTVSWFLASFIGCFPYLITGCIDSFIDAFFESVSGFTTTGATILTELETLPKGILFWRSFCQWLGGMGILVFAISILPALGISGQHMAKAETPGISLNKIVPRMSDTAKILYIIYALFTLLAVLLLKIGGLSLFDSVIASMGSVASGGLSNYSGGVSHFNSIFVELITSLFTVFTCVNFTIYYTILRGKWKEAFTNVELRTFVLILVVAGLLISMNLKLSGSFQTVGESLRYGLFQSSAFITTTGHYSTNFDVWPTFSKMILLLLMIIGASSSSTGGGIKIIRIVILGKLIHRGIFIRLHPRAVAPIKIQGKTLSNEMISGIVSFLSLYAFFFVASLLVLSLENMDFLTTVSTVASMLNNVGTGMGLVGPSGSFEAFCGFSKVYLSFLMIIGRLELFTVLLLFTPSFWNPDR